VAARLGEPENKAGNWDAWYDEAIPLVEIRYAEYVAERKRESGK
jgi:hypothetical protein